MHNLYMAEVFFLNADIMVGVSDVIPIFMNEINLTLPHCGKLVPANARS